MTLSASRNLRVLMATMDSGGSMKVWIDIFHTPQYNFYRNFICSLSASGHTVYVTLLDRGRLVKIVRKEIGNLPGVEISVVGRHAMSKLSAIWEANVVRIVRLFRWAKGRKMDISFSNGFHSALYCWLFRIPCYCFDDDPDTIDYRPKIWFSSLSHYCLGTSDVAGYSSRVKFLPVLKEWAYLAPNVFSPCETALEEYGVKPYSYLFLREVSVGTVNYAGQSADSILKIAPLIPSDVLVLLSLEKKDSVMAYPSSWIVLQEPVKDIHSLIFYSCGLISSGDSMAREAALMGVPSYYLGIRYDMPANAAASRVAHLDNRKSADVGRWISMVVASSASPSNAAGRQKDVRDNVAAQFIDINEYMKELLANGGR